MICKDPDTLDVFGHSVIRSGYHRKCSNAGKVSVYHLEELRADFLADIAEVVMIEWPIPSDLIFNWDQTAFQLVPTGQWTMNLAGEKIIPIVHSDNKRQVTAVLAATLTGESMPPQIIYQGKTVRCHPKVMTVPGEWDIWHTAKMKTQWRCFGLFSWTIYTWFLCTSWKTWDNLAYVINSPRL